MVPVRSIRCESGQAAVEWIGLITLVAGAMLALLALAAGALPGAGLARTVAAKIVCAAGVGEGCATEIADPLTAAYGEVIAKLMRDDAPELVYEADSSALPVDYRSCRSHRCSDAPDDRDLDAHRTRRGMPATVFTHVVRRGRQTYIQYWFYYPDSPSTFAGSHAILKALHIHDPAFHPDDWEGYQVRIGRHGSHSVRATKHGGYTWCKGHIWHNKCERWGSPNGWTRISRGSHAGHIPDTTPGTGLHERSTTAPGLHPLPWAFQTASITAMNVNHTMRVGVGSSQIDESRIFEKSLLYTDQRRVAPYLRPDEAQAVVDAREQELLRAEKERQKAERKQLREKKAREKAEDEGATTHANLLSNRPRTASGTISDPAAVSRLRCAGGPVAQLVRAADS